VFPRYEYEYLEQSFWCDPDATKLNETISRLNAKTRIEEESIHSLTDGEEYARVDHPGYIPAHHILDKVIVETKKSAKETLEKWQKKLDFITPLKKELDIRYTKQQIKSHKKR
jgi:hypothetical protein